LTLETNTLKHSEKRIFHQTNFLTGCKGTAFFWNAQEKTQKKRKKSAFSKKNE
jgi:hypothetical protein